MADGRGDLEERDEILWGFTASLAEDVTAAAAAAAADIGAV